MTEQKLGTKEVSKSNEAHESNGDLLLNIEDFTISQNFEETGEARKIVVRVPMRKPNRNEFIRVHPGESYSLRCAIAEDPDSRDLYIMKGSIADQYPDLCRKVKLVTAITRQNDPFLWPLKLPLGDRRGGAWIESAFQGAERAKHKWVKLSADMSAGQYIVYEATGNLEEPAWPKMGFMKLFNMALKDYVIKDPDHPLIQKLTGKI